MGWTLAAIAELTGGVLAGRADLVIDGIASPEVAGPSDLTLVVAPQQITRLARSRAGAAIVPDGVDVGGRDVVRHRSPFLALAQVLDLMYPPTRMPAGLHPSAFVDESAQLGEGVRVGPHAVVQTNAVLGDGVRIGAGAYVGRNVKIGANTVLFPHAVLYERVKVGRNCIIHSGAVIGADGFGYTRDQGRHRKIPQVGGVDIADDVEIGANTCIDAGTMEPTRIGENTKIDNLVQIGHNCAIGRRVIICGAASLAGSTIVEDDVTIAGQSGFAGHLTIGKGATVTAQAGVIADVPPGAVVAGMPEQPIEDWRRTAAATRRLPDIIHELRELRRRVDELDKRKS